MLERGYATFLSARGAPMLLSTHQPGESHGYARVAAMDVREILGQHVLLDGYDFVLDLAASEGLWLVDAVTGTRLLDMFSFFGSSALGMNPPRLTGDEEFMRHLGAVSVSKPSNPDVYTSEYATFVATFARVLGDPMLPHLFFVEGGALAVENALKAAFDWKAKRTGRAAEDSPDLTALHLKHAFHGRSGYTLSLTNTDPVKTMTFPKFRWPRIPSPAVRFPLDRYLPEVVADEREALRQARAAFEAAPDDIACFVVEPIQAEGGDRHLRAEFLLAMQQLCREYDALLVLDEVQTGCGVTGTAWAYQQLGLEPDLVAFGKKTQVCGVMAGRRIEEVPDNVFRVSSRISSTWGGGLTDMVRATRILEVIEEEELIGAAAHKGRYILHGLERLANDHPSLVENPRGRGLLCAVDFVDPVLRDAALHRLYRYERVIALPCGRRGLRLRPPLTVEKEHIDYALAAFDRTLLNLGLRVEA